MSTKLKLYIGRKVIDSLNHPTKLTPLELLPILSIGDHHPNNNLELNLPIKYLEKQWGITNINHILKIQPDDIIRSISVQQSQKGRINDRNVSFEIDRSIFMKDIIENNIKSNLNLKPKKIVIDFSSPNIAKPFHFGHLRSTIIGNFISNLNEYLFNKVVRLNYLGDWGTQFGLIKVGVDELKYTEQDIKQSPLKLLYNSYVHANKLSETDEKIRDRARNEFNKLERNTSDDAKDNYWRNYVDYSKKELERTYERLNVKFDEYNYESMYSANNIKDILEILDKKNITHKEADGKVTATINEFQKVTLMKSDGSTLYLIRDIAAAYDRFKRHNFDKMYYVVDNSQTDHFNALKSLLHRMNNTWSDRLQHVKFGRVRGMSTRKGNAVFLNDILDECRDLMIKKQIESPTTKVPINNHNVSDILGISCVIINDLKQRRQRDYEFTWDRVLQVQGDTGVRLQYTHCRLCSLERNSGVIPAKICNPLLVQENEITTVIRELAKFQEVLFKANEQLEAYILVNYLFHLCNHINKAFKVLQVKGQEPDVASQRLLIFKTSKEVLREGMSILGLQPLQEM